MADDPTGIPRQWPQQPAPAAPPPDPNPPAQNWYSRFTPLGDVAQQYFMPFSQMKNPDTPEANAAYSEAWRRAQTTGEKKLPAVPGSKRFSTTEGAALDALYNVGFGVPARIARPAIEAATASQSALEGLANAATQRAAQARMPVQRTPQGWFMWHGSPHIFERFDVGKRGTGEGGELRGAGLYQATHPNVAKGYARGYGLTDPSGNQVPFANSWEQGVAEESMITYGGHLGEHATNLQRQLGEYTRMYQEAVARGGNAGREIDLSYAIRDIQDELALVRKWNQQGLQVGNVGQLYRTFTNRAPAEFLDLDKKLWEQPLEVRENLKRMIGTRRTDGKFDQARWDEWWRTNKEVNAWEAYHHGLLDPGGDYATTSARLKGAGIPGQKFLDQFSRFGQAETPTQNAVFFGDEDLQILARQAIQGAR